MTSLFWKDWGIQVEQNQLNWRTFFSLFRAYLCENALGMSDKNLHGVRPVQMNEDSAVLCQWIIIPRMYVIKTCNAKTIIISE